MLFERLNPCVCVCAHPRLMTDIEVFIVMLRESVWKIQTDNQIVRASATTLQPATKWLNWQRMTLFRQIKIVTDSAFVNLFQKYSTSTIEHSERINSINTKLNRVAHFRIDVRLNFLLLIYIFLTFRCVIIRLWGFNDLIATSQIFIKQNQ